MSLEKRTAPFWEKEIQSAWQSAALVTKSTETPRFCTTDAGMEDIQNKHDCNQRILACGGTFWAVQNRVCEYVNKT